MKPDYKFSDFFKKTMDSFSGKSVIDENLAADMNLADIDNPSNDFFSISINAISSGQKDPNYFVFKMLTQETFPLIQGLCGVFLSLYDFLQNPSREYNSANFNTQKYYAAINNIINKRTSKNNLTGSAENVTGMSIEEYNGTFTHFVDDIYKFIRKLRYIEGIVDYLDTDDIVYLQDHNGDILTPLKNLCVQLSKYSINGKTDQQLIWLTQENRLFFHLLGEFIDIFEEALRNNKTNLFGETDDDSSENVAQNDEEDAPDSSDSSEEKFRQAIIDAEDDYFDDLGIAKESVEGQFQLTFHNQAELYAKYRNQMEKILHVNGRSYGEPSWEDELVSDYDNLAKKISHVWIRMDGE